MSTCLTTTKKDESCFEEHCEGRNAEAIGYWFYLSNIGHSMGIPLVIVPKKNGKWQICVDYMEFYKATQKDHFHLIFID